MRCERGQATVEWIGLVLLVAVALGGVGSVPPHVDGRSFGGFLAHRLVCAVERRCDDGDAALARAYGAHGAALVRRLAPNLVYEPGERSLPIDWRRCRARRCADAPDDRDLDAHRSRTGQRATVFVRVVRRDGRTYVQYWFYYPDSNTTWAASDKIWEHSFLLPLVGRVLRGSADYPGFHEDDCALRQHMPQSTRPGRWSPCSRRARTIPLRGCCPEAEVANTSATRRG